MNIVAEYIWIDGSEPRAFLRSKTCLIPSLRSEFVNDCLSDIPAWGFDGSSTNQATAQNSDCMLEPVKIVRDPLRGGNSVLVLCEVLNADGTPAKNNYRNAAVEIHSKYEFSKPIFGMEQEYNLFSGHLPLGLAKGHPPAQGPFYCGVGQDNDFGGDVAEIHMFACLDAGLAWCGKNGEVMFGQQEFQVGPKEPLTVADDIWLARYLLHKLAQKTGLSVKLDAKPFKGLNGAGMHTNFSTKCMRADGGLKYCVEAAKKLGVAASAERCEAPEKEGHVIEALVYPSEYGNDYQSRLKGGFETLPWNKFKYGVADREASVRIPLHVAQAEKGYIEDRRPCADADPYRIVSYIMSVCC